MQVTKSFIWLIVNNDPAFAIKEVSDYNDINQFFGQAEFLVVATAGCVIVEVDHIRDKINSIPSNVGIIGHLLKYSGEITPWIHEQFFIINTAAIKQVSLSFNTVTDYGTELVCSKEDLHDGHAPLFVTLGDKQVRRELKFGTNLIESCLNANYLVRNFDNDWRFPNKPSGYLDTQLPSHGYCYPCQSTDEFATALKELVITPGLDDAQKLIIKALKEALEFRVLNMWNQDTVPNVDADTVICPTNGFLGEFLSKASGAKRIVFYDVNRNNIEFKKYLYSEWDGNNYEELAYNWAKDRNLSIEPVFENELKTCQVWIDKAKETILSDWAEWRKTVTVEFLVCDIIKDLHVVLDKVHGKTILHTSTILSIFPFSAFVYDQDDIEIVRQTITNYVTQQNLTWVET